MLRLPEHTDYQKQLFDRLISEDDATGMFALHETLDIGVWQSLYNSFEKGRIGTCKGIVNGLVDRGRETLRASLEAIQDDSTAIPEVIAELSEDEVDILCKWAGAELEMEIRHEAGN